jgi:hypothetical protein
MLALALISSGCLKKTLTDERMMQAVQTFLDTPPDASNSNPDLLTVEERAGVQSFEVYRNTVKVYLVEGTAETLWAPIGRKIVKVFAKANRDEKLLADSYYAELYIPGEFEGKHYDRLIIGTVRLQNASDRTYPELGRPRLRR